MRHVFTFYLGACAVGHGGVAGVPPGGRGCRHHSLHSSRAWRGAGYLWTCQGGIWPQHGRLLIQGKDIKTRSNQLVYLLLGYVLAASKIISGWESTCDSDIDIMVRSYRVATLSLVVQWNMMLCFIGGKKQNRQSVHSCRWGVAAWFFLGEVRHRWSSGNWWLEGQQGISRAFIACVCVWYSDLQWGALKRAFCLGVGVFLKTFRWPTLGQAWQIQYAIHCATEINTRDSARFWWLYSAAPLGDQVTSILTISYSHIILIMCKPVLVLSY